MICPKCGFNQSDGTDCMQCGTNVRHYANEQTARVDLLRLRRRLRGRAVVGAAAGVVAIAALWGLTCDMQRRDARHAPAAQMVTVINDAGESVQVPASKEPPITVHAEPLAEPSPAHEEAPAAVEAPPGAEPKAAAVEPKPVPAVPTAAAGETVRGKNVTGCAPLPRDDGAKLSAVASARLPAGSEKTDAERLAEKWQEILELADKDPVGRWAGCLRRFHAVAKANSGRPVVECIATIDVCGDDRGAPGCCPSLCLEQHRQLCTGGLCEDPLREMKVFEKGIMTKNCMPRHNDPLGH